MLNLNPGALFHLGNSTEGFHFGLDQLSRCAEDCCRGVQTYQSSRRKLATALALSPRLKCGLQDSAVTEFGIAACLRWILTDCILLATISCMMEIRKTEVFVNWLDDLSDLNARVRVLVRIERLVAGNPGDVKPVGEGVSELRINYGPGYRVYYKIEENAIVILLAGGDKSTQTRDIKIALNLARTI
jgi:putative addiction module killer protein